MSAMVGRADEDRRSGINTAAAVAGALGTGHGHVNPMWQQLPRRRRPCKFVLRKGSMRLHICGNDGGWLCCKCSGFLTKGVKHHCYQSHLTDI
uniref:Uncharacterized protein n=1 Tax=Oryza rufipogon TaxID=4529 RepID=A0A0E0PQ43_ORYRU